MREETITSKELSDRGIVLKCEDCGASSDDIAACDYWHVLRLGKNKIRLCHRCLRGVTEMTRGARQLILEKERENRNRIPKINK